MNYFPQELTKTVPKGQWLVILDFYIVLKCYIDLQESADVDFSQRLPKSFLDQSLWPLHSWLFLLVSVTAE